MLLLEAELAVYKRLTGYPLDAKGRPLLGTDGLPKNREVIGPPDLLPYERIYDPITDTFQPVFPKLPSYGIRIPTMKAPFMGQRGLTSQDPVALRLFDGFESNSFKQVPVFDQNISGRKWEDVWPCVTFRTMAVDFDPKVFVYHDPFNDPDTSSAPFDVQNYKGDVVQQGYVKNLVRPTPDSWVITMVITAWAKESMELALLCAEIMKLFPPKGALTVTWASGEQHTCDMLLQRTETLDSGGNDVFATQGPEEQRSFARAFVFQIEGYFDNTANKYGIQGSALAQREQIAIRERLLEIHDIMTGVAGAERDLNLNELLPIT